MPRSGTTLVEQILSSHPDVAGGGELTFWGERAASFRANANGAIDPAWVNQTAHDYRALLTANPFPTFSLGSLFCNVRTRPVSPPSPVVLELLDLEAMLGGVFAAGSFPKMAQLSKVQNSLTQNALHLLIAAHGSQRCPSDQRSHLIHHHPDTAVRRRRRDPLAVVVDGP